MGSFSIWHLIIVLLFLLIPLGMILGLIKSVNNKNITHAILSLLIPFYGFVYFFTKNPK